MEIDQQQPPQQPQAAPQPLIATTTPAAVLDLNPTAFVDDLCNSVRSVNGYPAHLVFFPAFSCPSTTPSIFNFPTLFSCRLNSTVPQRLTNWIGTSSFHHSITTDHAYAHSFLVSLPPSRTLNNFTLNTSPSHSHTTLYSALRTALQEDLTPEQLTVLFQGTAGLYQDLRMEVKRQMQAFEEYALEEILTVPVGIMADLPPSTTGTGTGTGTLGDTDPLPNATPEQEEAVEEELKSLRKEIAARKRHLRDVLYVTTHLERSVAETQARLQALEIVPQALAGRENLAHDAKAMTDTCAAVEAGCVALERQQQQQQQQQQRGGGYNDGDDDDDDVHGGIENQRHQPSSLIVPVDTLTDAQVEVELLRQQAAVRQAPADDVRAVRQGLGL